MRNNQKIRTLFAEIMCVLCNSHKRNSFTAIKVKSSDFNLQNINGKLKAENLDYGRNYF